jgi:hypothetical protein
MTRLWATPQSHFSSFPLSHFAGRVFQKNCPHSPCLIFWVHSTTEDRDGTGSGRVNAARGKEQTKRNQ